MLPKEHFDRIEKDAIDMINSNEQKSIKKIVEIKENVIDRTADASLDGDDEDDYEYDYNYDDYKDDIVNSTQKSPLTMKCKFIISNIVWINAELFVKRKNNVH